MEDRIFIAEISIHYEQRPTIIHEWSRERYARRLAQEKICQTANWYLKRVTLAKANQILEDEGREAFRKSYDKAIMQKYNVGANYRENRWFMEQVRPNI
jgi:ABC-type transporter MlaC component